MLQMNAQGNGIASGHFSGYTGLSTYFHTKRTRWPGTCTVYFTRGTQGIITKPCSKLFPAKGSLATWLQIITAIPLCDLTPFYTYKYLETSETCIDCLQFVITCRQTSNASRTWVGNKMVDHWDVVIHALFHILKVHPKIDFLKVFLHNNRPARLWCQGHL